ncbi:DNA-directed RNA polymerase delta subunit [Paenibacillus peoriae]|uniref:DNA-directed RNA polymerase delta subunit n=1 Tax=Paenibacillus peoriae TaxID=59893 RepID=A0ABU1QIJ6_9BACL|nr:hypothetical protein [Paenibacillus peoriae]MDR6779484.1 DNA-directed RNA polymerase delta subunit [Paenibacillus peoriae]
MKLKQSEINKLARRIAKANSALYDAIILVEEVAFDDTIGKIIKDHDGEYDEILSRIVEAYKKLNKQDDSFIDAGNHGRGLQDFDILTGKIVDFLDEDEE